MLVLLLINLITFLLLYYKAYRILIRQPKHRKSLSPSPFGDMMIGLGIFIGLTFTCYFGFETSSPFKGGPMAFPDNSIQTFIMYTLASLFMAGCFLFAQIQLKWLITFYSICGTVLFAGFIYSGWQTNTLPHENPVVYSSGMEVFMLIEAMLFYFPAMGFLLLYTSNPGRFRL